MPEFTIDLLQKRAAATPGLVGLAGGLPAMDLMPRDLLASVLRDVSRDNDALQYGWPEGVASLRQWVVDRLAQRGAVVDADRVIITAGAQQALALIGMRHRGRQIAVGAQTYPAAISAFERAGAEVVESGAAILYVMPGVANPSGVDLVPHARAMAAHSTGASWIADEAYTELRFDGHIATALLADAPDRVWHIGTLSKTVSPGLRVGWLIPPLGKHNEMLDFKEAVDLQASSITQAIATTLLDRLDYDAHLERARAAYRRRALVLCDALTRALPFARFAEPEGGFAVWVELDDAGDDIALLAAAIEAGTSLDPGCMFRPRRRVMPVAFRLSFSSSPIDQLAEGVRRLAVAIKRWRRT